MFHSLALESAGIFFIFGESSASMADFPRQPFYFIFLSQVLKIFNGEVDEKLLAGMLVCGIYVPHVHNHGGYTEDFTDMT